MAVPASRPATAGRVSAGLLPVGFAVLAGEAWVPELFGRLRYGRSAAAPAPPAGRGWLDRAERQAVDTNQERRPVGS